MNYLKKNNNQDDSNTDLLAYGKIKEEHSRQEIQDLHAEDGLNEQHDNLDKSFKYTKSEFTKPGWKSFKSRMKVLISKVFAYKGRSEESFKDDLDSEEDKEEDRHESYTQKKKHKKHKRASYGYGKYSKRRARLKYEIINSLIYLRRMRTLQNAKNFKALKRLSSLITIYRQNILSQKIADTARNINMKEQVKSKITGGIKETQVNNQKVILDKKNTTISIKQAQQSIEQRGGKPLSTHKPSVQHMVMNDRAMLQNRINIHYTIAPYLKISKTLLQGGFKFFSLLTINAVKKMAITTTHTFGVATQFVNHHHNEPVPKNLSSNTVVPASLVVVLTTTFQNPDKALQDNSMQKSPSLSFSSSVQIDANSNNQITK
ncbi:hypothetical protein CAXC1_100003 [Candidatus Xenohaliotis californiensis]|uniref:Uncharacterized protein n=1 Tax=Candidatus Xenohaliotis californiensis TaxID=84677 RepID=A0ABM9N6S7_9RICK|nr:hypothetical protein CAXC1_100003 [Candidatus Xenohaliotis californiensis]